jgi:hypothetical protein
MLLRALRGSREWVKHECPRIWRLTPYFASRTTLASRWQFDESRQSLSLSPFSRKHLTFLLR